MDYDTSQLEDLENYNPSGNTSKNNSPNEALMIITEVKGLVSEIVNKLIGKKTIEEPGLQTKTPLQKAAKDKAIEEINLFEVTTLHELQKAFE